MSKIRELVRKLDRRTADLAIQRDCLWTTGTYEKCLCVTCSKEMMVGANGMNAPQVGHFIPRRFFTVRWNLTNVHAQCYRCNVELDGYRFRYATLLAAAYAPSEVLGLMTAATILKPSALLEQVTPGLTYEESLEQLLASLNAMEPADIVPKCPFVTAFEQAKKDAATVFSVLGSDALAKRINTVGSYLVSATISHIRIGLMREVEGNYRAVVWSEKGCFILSVDKALAKLYGPFPDIKDAAKHLVVGEDEDEI